MKIRQGYVSNSSSSSFIVATKKELDEKTLLEAFQTPPGHPLRDFAKQISKLIVSKTENVDIETAQEEAKKYNDSYSKKIVKLVKNGWYVYTGSFYDDDGGLEGFLCGDGLTIKTEDLILESDGY